MKTQNFQVGVIKYTNVLNNHVGLTMPVHLLIVNDEDYVHSTRKAFTCRNYLKSQAKAKKIKAVACAHVDVLTQKIRRNRKMGNQDEVNPVQAKKLMNDNGGATTA